MAYSPDPRDPQILWLWKPSSGSNNLSVWRLSLMLTMLDIEPNYTFYEYYNSHDIYNKSTSYNNSRHNCGILLQIFYGFTWWIWPVSVHICIYIPIFELISVTMSLYGCLFWSDVQDWSVLFFKNLSWILLPFTVGDKTVHMLWTLWLCSK